MDVLTESRFPIADPVAVPEEASQSAVSWAAIFCGAVVAAAVSLVLFALGSAMNLAAISPWEGAGVSVTTFTVMAAIWFIVTQWVASGIGGYLTGRLRTKWVALHTHEVFFRDTAHGFVTWALATLLAASLLGVAALSLASSGAHALGAASSDATRSAAGSPSVGAYELDALFRGARTEGNTDPRPEVARIIAKGLTGNGVSPADRSYVASLVSARTGISQAAAEQRVDSLVTSVREAADRARKASARAAFATALSLLIGAFIACVAAALGGQRRDAAASTIAR